MCKIGSECAVIMFSHTCEHLIDSHCLLIFLYSLRNPFHKHLQFRASLDHRSPVVGRSIVGFRSSKTSGRSFLGPQSDYVVFRGGSSGPPPDEWENKALLAIWPTKAPAKWSHFRPPFRGPRTTFRRHPRAPITGPLLGHFS